MLGFHIGTGGDTVVFRGPGGAIVNYMETTYPGMRVVSHLVACGALDRHPGLRILIAEGGAAWVPAMGTGCWTRRTGSTACSSGPS